MHPDYTREQLALKNPEELIRIWHNLYTKVNGIAPGASHYGHGWYALGTSGFTGTRRRRDEVIDCILMLQLRIRSLQENTMVGKNVTLKRPLELASGDVIGTDEILTVTRQELGHADLSQKSMCPTCGHIIQAAAIFSIPTNELTVTSMQPPKQTPFPWTSIKIAFPIDDPDLLWYEYDEGFFVPPDNWALSETDRTGSRCVAIFEVRGSPTIQDGQRVSDALRKLGEKEGNDHL